MLAGPVRASVPMNNQTLDSEVLTDWSVETLGFEAFITMDA